MEAQGAAAALEVPRRLPRQVEGPAAFVMESFHLRPDLVKMNPETDGAISQAGGNDPVSATAVSAGGHGGTGNL